MHWPLRAASRAHFIAPVVLGVTSWAPAVQARSLLVADGPGMTYELIEHLYNPEVPDCGHMVPHITEDFDDELQKNVFIFHAHVNQDDDRCGATDRQRTEIRAHVPDISAQNGETVYYRWKFKLPTGFQATQAFTHIFQIKSNQADPIMTLTPRTSTIEVGGRIGTHGSTTLSKFLGVWAVVDLKVLYANSGNVAISIRRLSDGLVLLSYSGNADMWDDGSGGHDSKFGIYRSLDERSRLRDEQVRFADFCTSKVSAAECEDGPVPPMDASAPPIDAAGPDAGRPPDAASPIDATRPDETGSGGAGGQGGAAGSSTTTSGTAGATGTPGTSGPTGTGGTLGASGAGGNTNHGGGPGGSRPSDVQGQALGCSCKLSSSGTSGGPAAVAGILAYALAPLGRRRRRVSR